MSFQQLFLLVCAFSVLALLLLRMADLFQSRMVGSGNTRLTIVIHADENPAELERSVRGLLRLMKKNEIGSQTEIIIKNMRHNDETTRMAEIFEREYPSVRVEAPSDIFL